MEMQIALHRIYLASEYQAKCCRLHKVPITQISLQTPVHAFDIVALDVVGPVTKPELTIALLCKNDKAHNSTTEQKRYPSHTHKETKPLIYCIISSNLKQQKSTNA